jgi:hypothetical protein
MRHDAAYIHDHLDLAVRPTVVLMNPPPFENKAGRPAAGHAAVMDGKCRIPGHFFLAYIKCTFVSLPLVGRVLSYACNLVLQMWNEAETQRRDSRTMRRAA